MARKSIVDTINIVRDKTILIILRKAPTLQKNRFTYSKPPALPAREALVRI